MKKLMIILISYQLIFAQTLLYANGISDIVRTEDKRDGIVDGSLPTDIPFLDYTDSFMPEKMKLIDQEDLSSYVGKNIYVGYGIFDSGDNYCKYVDLPTPPSEKIEIKFEEIRTFNNKTYALYRNGNVSYHTCQNIANEYGGIIATPHNVSENAFIGQYKVENWLGINKSSCSSEYFDSEGEPTTYTNWTAIQDTSECSSSELHVKQNDRKTWEKVSKNETNRCIIQINSPFADRPVKLCAPWWRVERTYTKPDNYTVNGLNLLTINQADVPELYNVCTKMNSQAIAAIDNNETYEFQCTTYYDATQAPECLRNPLQPQCEVSECQGFVENACKHIQTVKPMKDYTKIVVMSNGVETEVRGKDMIRTQVYECPLVIPSSDDCLERSSVVAYPKECPGSSCQGKKECYAEASDSDGFLQCDQDFSCEKIYPTIDRLPDPSDLDGSGNLKRLRGKCSDGTILLFPVNIQDKVDKTCKEYSKIEEHKKISKKCLLERNFHDIVLNMAITDEDVYASDPDCVRTNNIVDARPIESFLFDITYFNYAENIISKVRMPNTKDVLNSAGSGNYLKAAGEAVFTLDSANGSVGSGDSNSIGGCPLSSSGSEAVVGSWMENKIKPIIDNDLIQTIYSSTKVLVNGTTADKAECDSIASSIGGTTISGNGTNCRITRTSTNQDKLFAKIKSLGSVGDPSDPDKLIEYTSSNTSYTDEQCVDWADCLDGAGFLNAGSQCVATQTETETDTGSYVDGNPEVVVDCKPDSGADQVTSTLNGLTDIFLIEDTVPGNFGYSSNYLSHPYVANTVEINGKEVFPITQPSVIVDTLDYLSKIKLKSITTKKPNILAAAIGGGGTGMLAFTSISVPVLSFAIVGVAYLAAALFGKKKKYNEASVYWLLYKDIPKLSYIKGPYDGRKAKDMGTFVRVKYALGGEDPGDTAVSGFGWRSFSGTIKRGGDFQTFMGNLYKKKQQDFACLGLIADETPKTNKEMGLEVPGFPGCKWYKPNCNKSSLGALEEYSSSIDKDMNGFYLGADNSISIVTPYIGDYEIEGFDQYGDSLGQIRILEDEFINETASKMSYAQVNFGTVMKLAEGLAEGSTSGACREVNMVEFGGGVSGIYFENNNAGGLYDAKCEKSNDIYVKDHALTKIKIRPVNQDDFIELELTRPMPYANRIKLVTMSQKEIRKYRCYLDFGECQDEDYITKE